MATAKKNTRKKTEPAQKAAPVSKSSRVSVKKTIRDERTHKIMGFFLVLMAIGLVLSFISYGFTWKQDQDKVFNADAFFIFNREIQVENTLGRLGAWVSHLFIYKGFGIASYFLCILPFVLGVNLVFKKNIFRIWRNVFYAVTGLFYFSVTLAFFTKSSEFSFGGGLGEWLADWVTSVTGTVGTALLLIVLGIAWFVWRFNPVFRVPKKPNITLPPFVKKEPVVPETDLLATEPTLATEKTETKEKNGAGVAPIPVTPTQTPQTNLAAATEAPVPALPKIDATLTGLSINDLYALGRAEELARKRFIPDDPVNPLTTQSIESKGNRIDETGSTTVVVPPSASPVAAADPINQFSLSDQPLTNAAGEPEWLINPIPEEKELVTVIPPQPAVSTETFTPETVATQEEIQLQPEHQPLEKNELSAASNRVENGKDKSYPKLPTEKSNPVLEIKPPVAEQASNNEIPSDKPQPEIKKIENLEPYDPKLDLKGYTYPEIDLLETHGSERIVTDPEELESNKNQILNTLKNYDIHIQRISATVGPTVTLYEIVPAPGVRISRIKNLEDDIALSLAALGIRIIAPIPGKGTIGIEVPNVRKTIVSMRTLLASEKFQHTNFSLPIAIGKKIDNELFVVDLASMPHLLMAGATGQGKSVGINAVLVSLLYKKHPSQLKLVLVDPKKVELSLYRAIEKHFLAKLPGEEESIITDTKKVVHTLNALCIEMDNRYDLLKDAGVRNIKEYNEKFVKRRLSPEKGHQFLPFIVLVVDEFADLIMTAGKEVEMPIARLAQLARAIGIHLIIATQRPSVNIITGTIKANFPSRIAFKVSSKIDSRTILDAGGAEQLIGKGDMLISHNGELIRLQCAFVDTPEVERVCEDIGSQRGYPEAFLLPEYVDEKEMEARDFDISDRDSLFEEAAQLIVQHQQGSTSLIQRRMKLGYNRAGRLMDQLEKAGIVGPNQGSKPRDVLVKTEMDLQELLTRF